ncbi:DUF5337 domain-containing protein [Jannaschia sp. Os4]|uniref:DUF5337 family protein n=1 Tax=Jannaschia sp. Os4 TaxID=2807617 RepID=UPI001939A57F|nr:DUF5337 family protein [Jannaschia sp. Os4]MBM2576192.1 DUF5337 domain-containing protein [Jannaschia sp. Os4]
MTAPDDLTRARRARTLALTIVGTFAAWMIVQALGATYGWPARWVALFDLAALAVLGWAVVAGILMWRARRTGDE